MSKALDRSIWRSTVLFAGFFILNPPEISWLSSFRAETVECFFPESVLELGDGEVFLQGGEEKSFKYFNGGAKQ